MAKEDHEHRITTIEGVLGGTLNTPGLVHVQREIAETVYGRDNVNGLVRDVANLKMDRARGLAWIAGAAAAGGSTPFLFNWILKIFGS